MPTYADRVKETTTTTGTGAVTLLGAAPTFQTFAESVGDAGQVYYAIVHATADEWEVGLGTVSTSGPTTLSRDTVLSSSAGGAAVNLTAGVKAVYATLPASLAASWLVATSALEALGDVTPAADRLPYFTSTTTADVTELTSTGRSLIAAADAAAARSAIGANDASNLSTGSIPSGRVAEAAVTQHRAAMFPRGHIDGLTLAINATDGDHALDVAPGQARAQNGAYVFDLAATQTKRIDASWATGDAAGGLASALTLTGDMWYHVFAIDDGSGGTEFGFDSDATASNLLSDTGGTFYRRIGSVLTDASGNLTPFAQVGDLVQWDPALVDLNTTSPPTSATALTLSVPPVAGVEADVHLWIAATTGNYRWGYLWPGVVTDFSRDDPLHIDADGHAQASRLKILTSASGQVYYRAATASGWAGFRLVTYGYRDPRGRHA